MQDTISILSIPNELLGQIFDAIQDRASLAAAARTCHDLRDFAEARLYSHLSLRKREALEALKKLVDARPRRADFVRRLDLVFSTAQYDNRLEGVTTADAVTSFPYLNSLTVESPRCNAMSRINSSEWGRDWAADMSRYLKLFLSASLLSETNCDASPLQNLTTWETDRFWYTSASCPVFLMPNLEKLELSCVIVEAREGDRELLRFEGKTNLKTLGFTRSIVNSDSLDLLLKLPKALLRLELNEDVPRVVDPKMLVTIRSRDSSIRLSNNSLRQLTLSLRSHQFLHDVPMPQLQVDLSGLPSLESLQLGPNSSRFQPRWALVGRLPRNLALLRLAGFDARSLRRRGSLLSDLRLGEVGSDRARAKGLSMVIDLEPTSRGHHHSDMRDMLRDFEQIARELRPSRDDDGGGFEIQVTTAKPTRYIPPYLYQERRPQRVVRYISTRPDDGQFLERPYFELTGMPEDEADSKDQDDKAIELFASERVS
ncbi:uncharacterized protein PG986_002940 [Apiospora aurea]|uniref:F-box domain-containing protein n=1 Tax=Apiospora aurea TaxID=335848 RepID=A0ABR1QQ88_9PEZI